MKKAADSTTRTASDKNPFALRALGSTFLDTTWRMVVPVVSVTLLGIFLDVNLRTMPWFTLPAVVLGFVIAGWLIYRQIVRINASESDVVVPSPHKESRS